MVSTILTRVIKCLSRINWVGKVTWPRSGCVIDVAEAGNYSEQSIVVSKLPFDKTDVIISVEMSWSTSLLVLFWRYNIYWEDLRPTESLIFSLSWPKWMSAFSWERILLITYLLVHSLAEVILSNGASWSKTDVNLDSTSMRAIFIVVLPSSGSIFSQTFFIYD